MNKDIVKGHWHEIKGKLKHQWGDLTDDDVQSLSGDYESLQGTLQKRYGYAKEEAQEEIDKFLNEEGYSDL